MPKKEVKIIDSNIIWKCFHGKLSDDEEKFLKEWLEEDRAHAEYFENAKSYFEEGSSFHRSPYNINSGWRKIDSHIRKRETRDNYFKLGIAASLIIAISMVVWLSVKNPTRADLKEYATLIEPGTSSATLIIGDSITYEFNQGQRTSLVASLTNIETDGSELEYVQRENSPTQAAIHTLAIPRGGEFVLKLSDGTTVWLNAETELKYPETFLGDERRVELNGEAYFEVAHNNEKPFYVVSGDHEVKVLGTSFNISAYEDEEQIVTTLINGGVRVQDKFDALELTLEPLEQSTLERFANTLTKKKVEPYQFVAWKEKTFYFEDRSLGDIMRIMARWYDIDVFFDDSTAAEIHFTGGFKRYEEFNKIGNKIEMTNEVQFEIKGNTVIIK